MLGHGGVPWPFVRRSRFVKELERQGEAYRQNVYAAEAEAREESRRLRLAEDEFRQTVIALSGWREDGIHFNVDTGGEPEPQHFHMQMVRDYRGMRWTFVYDISDSMLMHMIKTLAPQQAQLLLQVITEKLVAQVLTKMYEEG